MPSQFECFQDGCSFLVRADTDEEIVHLVAEHARFAHDISIEQETIEAEIEHV